MSTQAGVVGPLSLNVIRNLPSGHAIVRVVPPTDATGLTADGSTVLPLDVVCVIDVSGSMSDSATVQDEKGNTESHGLNILDVVKHATATIGAMLRPQDRLSIVTFSTGATTEMPLTAMDAAGKRTLTATLERLTPDGNTNLWGGLQAAMDQVGSGWNGRTSAILILTDGRPTEEPPRGHIPTLDRYLAKFGGRVPFSVNTVGFGYNLNSDLLRTIADKTGGMYVFIPDSGLVGTVFLNLIANVQVTAAIGLALSFECSTGVSRAHPLLAVSRGGAAGSIGTIQFGQSRDLIVCLDNKASNVEIKARLQYTFSGCPYEATAVVSDVSSTADTDSLRNAIATESFLRCVSSMQKNTAVSTLLTELNALQPLTPLTEAFIKDVEGQIAMSFEPAHLQKWGRHFLPSILCANLRQQCNNFKDFSVQLYGGATFSKLRDDGEAAFLKLPPPKPSGCYNRGYSAAHAPAQMTSYYNYSGGCVTHDSLVAVQGGLTVLASNFTPGTVLSNGAVVKCVVRICTPTTGVTIVRFPWTRLAITAYHPIRDPTTGQWAFPLHVAGASSSLEQNHNYVYTFVLDGGHSVVVNDVEVVTLGHGLTDNDVVAHEYLGTERILRDIEACSGYSSGIVTVNSFSRDPKSNRVNGLVQSSAVSVIAAP